MHSAIRRFAPAATVFPRRATRLVALAGLLFAAACGDLPLEPNSSPPAEINPDPPAAPVGASMLLGARLWVDPASNAKRQADAWRNSRPADAAEMDRIAAQPQAIWLGDWIAEPYRRVEELTTRITAAGALPTFVVYNIPLRDCGHYSRGGAASADAYRAWIGEVARAIGNRRAAVIVEPDGLGLLDCMSAADRAVRVQLIRDAVRQLKASGTVSVYIDAGNPRWHPVATIADRLAQAGVAAADGFALNVSNFFSNQETIPYGEAVSRAVGGKHFVVDTSRNGLGPTADAAWCNPPGRALGTAPTTRTGHPLVDAFLWVKPPGESDGECNNGPSAGKWWPEYALGLARRSSI